MSELDPRSPRIRTSYGPLVSVESVWCLLLLPSSLSLGVLRGRFPWVKEIARREPTWSEGEEEGASWELRELLRTLTQVAGETVAVGPSLAKLEEQKGEELGQCAESAQYRPASRSPQWAAHLPAELQVCWTWTSLLQLQSERGVQLCPADQASKEKSQGNGDCGQNSRREARRKTGRSKYERFYLSSLEMAEEGKVRGKRPPPFSIHEKKGPIRKSPSRKIPANNLVQEGRQRPVTCGSSRLRAAEPG